MGDPNKKITMTNPLFVASVTGGTLEDYTQNALLMPAKEIPPPQIAPPIPQVPAGAPLGGTTAPSLLVPTEEGISLQGQGESSYQYFAGTPQVPFPSNQVYSQPLQGPSAPPQEYFPAPLQPQGYPQGTSYSDQPPQQFTPNQQQAFPVGQSFAPPQSQYSTIQDNLNISSVLSSFSNLLGRKTAPVAEEPYTAQPPAGIETLIGQGASAEPVPLFSPAAPPVVTELPTTYTGPQNSYRRPGLKRPTYAPVPGLSKTDSAQPESFNPFHHTQAAPAPQAPVTYTQLQQPTTAQTFFCPPITQTVSSSASILQPETSLNGTVANAILPDFVPDSFNTSPIMCDKHSNKHSSSAASSAPKVSFSPTPAMVLGSQVYRPVYHHWFHKKELEGKVIWTPFSMHDSIALEMAFMSNELDQDQVVGTDGGRYDVNILRRQRVPSYWQGKPHEVRRCSWFYRGCSDGKLAPYDENVATQLEEAYKCAVESNMWNKRVELPNKDTVILQSADVMALFPPSQSPDAWGNQATQSKPRVVKRGLDEFHIEDGEPEKVDHLLFMVHGIGSVCDLKFRSVEEVVDDFRNTALQLVQAHYHSSCEKGLANRVEVLPISWHDLLHTDTGIDTKLKSITLESIPRLRDFTNDTILDVLLYTSPRYCQTIVSDVGNQMNKVYELFKKRNPTFTGGVSLGGHSLGSLILFDLLTHQHPETTEKPILEDNEEEGIDDINAVGTSKPAPLKRKMSRRISYMMCREGTGQPQIHYPNLVFRPKAFFALGSPIGMFVTVRGLDTLGEEFALPTCDAFFNIFHPYDPVAYRIESLINPELAQVKPSLIPHHKGRKRMHLELKETMARVGADLKHRVLDTVKNTLNSFYQLAAFHRQDATLDEEVNKAIDKEMAKTDDSLDQDSVPEANTTDKSLGILNKGRRIDYVLQESPFEIFNDYIFALTSHVCYWESEDTILMILKEIYSEMGIHADSQVPQQTMTIERPSTSANGGSPPPGVNPTAPMQNQAVGPPPVSGFMRKT